MPHEPHHLFEQPDPASPIWRYMDFTKFVSLLETAALYFARLDLLGDPFEGSFPRPTIAARPEFWTKYGFPEEFVASMTDEYLLQRRLLYVSSWHLGEEESAAMWRLYLKSDEGIAIRSTVGRLIDAVRESSRRVFVGVVRYVDYDREAIPEGNMFYPIIHKRRSFQHERELRAVIADFEARETLLAGNDTQPGITLPVTLDVLIESVWVAPPAPTWMVELVGAVARRYGLDAPATQSRLSSDPLF